MSLKVIERRPGVFAFEDETGGAYIVDCPWCFAPMNHFRANAAGIGPGAGDYVRCGTCCNVSTLDNSMRLVRADDDEDA